MLSNHFLIDVFMRERHAKLAAFEVAAKEDAALGFVIVFVRGDVECPAINGGEEVKIFNVLGGHLRAHMVLACGGFGQGNDKGFKCGHGDGL